MLLFVSTVAPLPTMTRWSRDLVFHLAGVLTATVGMTFWITGVSTSLSLAITYFGLVVALGTLLGCRWFARLERRRAGIVLGAPIPEHYLALEDDRWTARLHTLMGDPTTWRDFAWTGLSGIVGLTLSVLALSLWGGVLHLITLPAWYWAAPDANDFGIVSIDSLPLALGAAVVGLALVPGAGYLSRALTVAELAYMRWLLALPLALHVSFSLLVGLVVTIIWAATGFGYFWPVWVWLGFGLTVALDLVVLRAQAGTPGPKRRLRVHGELSATVAALLVSIWALAGAGTFWPFWALLGLGILLALHAMIVHRKRLHPRRCRGRRGALPTRVHQPPRRHRRVRHADARADRRDRRHAGPAGDRSRRRARHRRRADGRGTRAARRPRLRPRLRSAPAQARDPEAARRPPRAVDAAGGVRRGRHDPRRRRRYPIRGTGRRARARQRRGEAGRSGGLITRRTGEANVNGACRRATVQWSTG